MNKEVVLSGIRPTGSLHIGNILGVVNNMVTLQNSDKYRCFFFLADLHAGTTNPNFHKIAEDTYGVLADLIACGLDIEKSIIFRQSDIPELFQLYTFFCFATTVAELERNPIYKEQITQLNLKGKGLSIFLNYPVLQAADICLYKAELIPIGQDQIPHIELTRRIAKRFNELCGASIFPLPEPLLTNFPKVPGTDGRKMSKSYNNFIALSDDEKTTYTKVANMLTDVKRPRLSDPGHPEECPVFSLHRFFSYPEDVKAIKSQCESAIISCKYDCKPALAQAINKTLHEPRQKRMELVQQHDFLTGILHQGGQKARAIASATIEEVRNALRLVANEIDFKELG